MKLATLEKRLEFLLVLGVIALAFYSGSRYQGREDSHRLFHANIVTVANNIYGSSIKTEQLKGGNCTYWQKLISNKSIKWKMAICVKLQPTGPK